VLPEANLLALRRYAILAGVALLALGSAAPTIAQLWLPLPQPLDGGQKLTIVAHLMLYIMMLSVGSWLVLARPGPMTWGFFWYLAGWRGQLLAVLANQQAMVAFPGGIAVWGRIEDLGPAPLAALAMAGLMMFALRFPYDRADGWRRSVERAIWVGYFPVDIICATAMDLVVDTVTNPHTGPYRGVVLFWFVAWVACGLVSFLFSIAILLLTFIQAGSEARQRLLWIAVLPVAIFLRQARLLSLFGSEESMAWLYDKLIIAGVIVPVAVAYAVLRYRVFDVQFALSRGMALSAVAAVVGVIVLCADWVLSRNAVSSPIQLALYIAVALGVGFALNVVLRRLSGGIDALLFRQRYLTQRGLEDIGRTLYSVDSRPGLYALLVRDVPEVLGATSAAIFERLDDGGYMRHSAVGWPAGAAWHLLPDHPVVLAAGRRSVARIDAIEWYDLGDMPPQTRPAIGIPILVGGRAQALFLLGPQRNGTDFDGAAVAAVRRLSDRVSAIYGALPGSAVGRPTSP
jgi:ABC-type multidrug transport system fused ATPase/permease subunit